VGIADVTSGQGMTWGTFSLILGGVLLNAVAQLALKASVSGTGAIGLDVASWWSSAPSLIASFWLWLGLVCYVVNAIAAWHRLGESLGPGRLTGIGIIIVGVFVLARS